MELELEMNRSGQIFTVSRTDQGFTLLELLVALFISGLIFAILMTLYSTVLIASHDHRVRLDTLIQGQAILQTVGNDLRVLGNGVPFDQVNFRIGDPTLSDPSVSEPIQVGTTTTTSITFRLNETGEVALLTQDFDPSLTLTVHLTDLHGLAPNDPIYISNSVVSGDDGLFGTIAQVNSASNSITLESGPVFSPGAVFPMGSILEEVPFVTIYSEAGGIFRDSGFGPVELGRNASISYEYLDSQGNVLSLPLTNQAVVLALRAIRVSVEIESETTFRDGTFYTATVSQIFGLRNLNYVY